MAGDLVTLLRDARDDLAAKAAGRIRLENPAYASRPVEEIAVNVRRILDAWTRYLERSDWGPMSAFLEDVTRLRGPMGFKVSDLVGAMTSTEETITELVNDEDATGEICASPHYAALRAAFHKARIELVDRFVAHSQDGASSLLEASYRHAAELESSLATEQTRGASAAAALRDDLIPGLEETVAELDRGVSPAAIRAHVERLLAATREALARLRARS